MCSAVSKRHRKRGFSWDVLLFFFAFFPENDTENVGLTTKSDTENFVEEPKMTQKAWAEQPKMTQKTWV